jgi:hypothetical protein
MPWTSEDYLRLYEAIAIVIATIMGPILAVQIQKKLERDRTRRDRQIDVFRTLMTQRLVITYENVKAFNSVPVEFYGVSGILVAWRAYLAHMGVQRPHPPADTSSWDNKRLDLFLALLQKMAVHIGYEYDFVQLKDDWYRPIGHGDLETEQQKLRQGLVALLEGKLSLPIDVRLVFGDQQATEVLKQRLKQSPQPPPKRNF